jgi:hypothetical protein
LARRAATSARERWSRALTYAPVWLRRYPVRWSRAALVAIPGAVLFFLKLIWIAFLELLAPIVAVALAPAFYWRLFVSDPRDAATLPTGDITELHYPYRRWVAEELSRGIPPLWNEFLSAGHSAIGDIQFHTLYPPDTFLAQLAGGSFPLVDFEAGIVAHVALGSLFMYLLARRLTHSRTGGLVSAVVFAFGGYLTGFPVQQMILLETSIWLPLILLCIDIGADFGMVSAFALGAGGLAMAALAGHPQTLFYVAVAALAYLLFKAWHGGWIRIAPILGAPVLFAGGMGLAAAALVPAFFHLALTDRTNVTYDFSSGGYGLREAMGIVFPVEFGAATLYNGLFSLILVAIALASPRRRSNKVFWLVLGVVGLIFSFGGNTFLQGMLYLALGSFKFRDHERLAFYVAVSVAILAGYGAAELARRPGPRWHWLGQLLRWPLAATGGIAILLVVTLATASSGATANLIPIVERVGFTALILGLTGAILLGRQRGVLSPGVTGLLAFLLVTFDLFSSHWQGNLRPGDPANLIATTPIVDYLENYTTGHFRIASEGLLPGDGNAGALFRFEDIVGNSPLETSDYAAFDKQVPELTRWQVLGVRYIVTQRKLTDPRFLLLRQDGPKSLYELDTIVRLPRAFVVRGIVPAPSQAAALSLVKDINVRTTAVVLSPAGPLLGLDQRDDPHSFDQAVRAPDDLPQPDFPVTIVQSDADTVVVDAKLASPGLLVLDDIDYPGWQATVDGVSAPIFRADGIVRSVYLTGGKHEVRFFFEPPGLELGSAISAETPMVLVGIVILEVVLQLIWLAGRGGWRIYRAARNRPT